MTSQDLQDLYHREMRHYLVTEGYRREETAEVVRSLSEFNRSGYILCSHLDEINASRIIEREVEYFRGLGQEFEWKVYDTDIPSNLGELLLGEGFHAEDSEAVMILPLDGHVSSATSSSALQVESLNSSDGVDEVIDLEESIWHTSYGSLRYALKQDVMHHRNDVRLYGIRVEGRLVSAGWMYLEKGSAFASCWGGATVPEFRGQGAYTALIEARSRDAYNADKRWLTVDAAGQMSRPILERCGFFRLHTACGYHSPR